MSFLKRYGLIVVVVIGGLIGERLGLIDLDALLGNVPSTEQQATTANNPVAAAGCDPASVRSHPNYAALERFGVREGLNRSDEFALVAITIHETGRLPDCYLTKGEARDRGWAPGASVWVTGQGNRIGGDRFGNREGRLPSQHNGRYIEADLDYNGARGRNAKRLVFVGGSQGQWLQWLTVDHYDSFTQVRP